MKNSRRDTVSIALSVAILCGALAGLSALMAACTPSGSNYVALPGAGDNGGSTSASTTGSGSTSDTTSGSTSSTTTGSGSTSDTTSGSTSSTASGSTGGTTGPAPGGDGGTTTSPSDDGGATAQVDATTGGDDGGDTTAASNDSGCNWVQTADGSWMFDPAAPDKIVIFDGSSLADFHKENQPGVPIDWTLNADGTMTVLPSGTGVAVLVQTNQKFNDLCVHVEYMTPMYPSSVTGQQRGNSGVYCKSAYEMQILDSYGDPPENDTCGAVYSIQPPKVVACNMELVWNTYEIEFKGSVWNDAGVKTKDAEYVKCALNGQIVQLDVDLDPAAGYTPAGIPDAPGPQPLGLQDHLCYVSFRNIWVREPQY
jgi:3-keto-disaccharide hydrolase